MALVLNASRQHAGLTVAELWLACFGIGWTGTEDDLADVLTGDRVPPSREYDVIAQAINDRFTELGHSYPVPYADEL